MPDLADEGKKQDGNSRGALSVQLEPLVTGDAALLVDADQLLALGTAAEARFLDLAGPGTPAHGVSSSGAVWRGLTNGTPLV
jgi:hypothetical protein